MKFLKLLLLVAMCTYLPKVSLASVSTLDGTQYRPFIEYDIDVLVPAPGVFTGCTNFHDAHVVANLTASKASKNSKHNPKVPERCGLVGSASVLEAFLSLREFQFRVNSELEMGMLIFDIPVGEIYMGKSKYRPVAMNPDGTLKIFVIVSKPLYSYLIKLYSR